MAASLPDASIDLVYIDPPFGTGSAWTMLQGRGGKGRRAGERAYEDGARSAPSEELAELFDQIERVLRPGGAFFLHLDWRTVHRAKILLDDIFGADNFLNEIIWHYATGGVPKRWFARKHDTILYYVKSDPDGNGHTFHRLQQKKYLAHKMSRKGVEEFRDEGGWYRYKFLDDVWTIPWLTQDAKERTGYPTQKPVALLERILEAATDPGDTVADFFAGSGTTAVAAMRLGRSWVVGDRAELSEETSKRRIEDEAESCAGWTSTQIAWDVLRSDRERSLGEKCPTDSKKKAGVKRPADSEEEGRFDVAG